MIFLLFFSIVLANNNENLDQNLQNSVNQMSNPTIDCTKDVSFIFHKNGLNISCYHFNQFYLYDEIENYHIDIKMSSQMRFYLDEVQNDFPGEHLIKIIKSIMISKFADVIFFGVLNGTLIESYKELFNNDVEIWIFINSGNCYWENKTNLPIDFYDINNHWKNICLYKDDGSSISLFSYNDENRRNIKYIKKSF